MPHSINKRFSLLLLPAGSLPATAYAHGDASILHSVSDGFGHVLTTPELLMLCLIVGLIPVRESRRLINIDALYFPAGILVGLVAGSLAHLHMTEPFLLSTLVYTFLIAAGTIVIIDKGLPNTPLFILYFLAGSLPGLQLQLGFMQYATTDFGIITGSVLTACAVFMASYIVTRRFATGWQKITLRVIGSWITAISVISLVVIFSDS